jgi:hypothetical protein
MWIELRVIKEGSRGSPVHKTFDADEVVVVRDVASRIVSKVSAKELSLYRHTLLIKGTGYRILEVMKQERASPRISGTG